MIHNTFAAIDIGSNAFRLLINYVESAPDGVVEFKKAAFLRVPVRLGEDVFTLGCIGDEKRRRMVEAMQGFAHLMRAFEVDDVIAYATSAMREAVNGAEIVEEIAQKSGIAVEIISGQKEAETIFEAGDTAGFAHSDKRYLYVDVGGGSTEITVYSNRRRVLSESFPLGTVRMISGGIDPDEKDRFKEFLREVRTKYSPVAIIGSGGNINKAAKLLFKTGSSVSGGAGRGGASPMRAGSMQGGVGSLRYAELKLLAERLSAMNYDERIERFGLNDYRADVIVPALEIFLMAARVCRIDEVIVPKIGLADGIIHKLYRKHRFPLA